jgi:hypothetical protein
MGKIKTGLEFSDQKIEIKMKRTYCYEKNINENNI